MPVTLKMTANAQGQRTWTGTIRLKRDTEMVAVYPIVGQPRRKVVKAGTEVTYTKQETRSGTYATVTHAPYRASKKLNDRDEAAERRQAGGGQYSTPAAQRQAREEAAGSPDFDELGGGNQTAAQFEDMGEGLPRFDAEPREARRARGQALKGQAAVARRSLKDLARHFRGGM